MLSGTRGGAMKYTRFYRNSRSIVGSTAPLPLPRTRSLPQPPPRRPCAPHAARRAESATRATWMTLASGPSATRLAYSDAWSTCQLPIAMRELITFAVGQAGNQIASAFWDTIRKEHGLDGEGVC